MNPTVSLNKNGVFSKYQGPTMRHSNGYDAAPLKETPLRPHRPLWGLVGRVFGEPADPVNRQDASVQCVVARAPLVDLTRFASGNGSGIVASFIGMPYRGEAGGGYAAEQRTYPEWLHRSQPCQLLAFQLR